MTRFALCVAVLLTLVVAIGAAAQPAPATQATSANHSLTWLAAGDSFASGQGLTHTTEPCADGTGQKGLSTTWAIAAARVLQSQGQSIAHGSPDLVACTGAISDEFFHSHTGLVDEIPVASDTPHGPQWTPKMGRFDLVTFSFGGDDIGFPSIMQHCVDHQGCPSDQAVRQKIKLLGSTGVYKGSLHIPSYPTFLRHVANSAVVKGGNVVVMGYPELVEDPSLWSPGRTSCAGMSAGQIQILRGWAGDLNATIGEAAAQVDGLPPAERNDVTITYVDPVSGQGADGIGASDPNLFEPSSGARHERCSLGPSWVNGEAPLHLESRSFHPNQAGEDAMGALAADVIAAMKWPWTPTWSNWRITGSLVATGETLDAVSCTSASFCMAVGTDLSSEADSADAPNGFVSEFGAYRWNGTNWTETPAPAPPSLASGSLDAVSCVTPSYCMGTGIGYPPVTSSSIGNLNGVAELWNGQSWSGTNFPGTNASASGIDCITTHWCMAILVPGQCVACGGQVSAALWNGSSWGLTPISGLTSAPGLTTFSLSCASTSFCMTTTDLDGQDMDSALQPMQDNVSYAFDGSGWHQVAWPDQSVSVGALACPSATSCVQMADANYGTPGYGGGEVTFLWNGSSWTKDSNPVAGGLAFASISCTSNTFCVGVGAPSSPAYDSGGNYIAPTSFPDGAAVWNGATWEATPPPNPGDQELSGVSCTSNQCVGVGSTTVELAISRSGN
jgi:hypothetical protein